MEGEQLSLFGEPAPAQRGARDEAAAAAEPLPAAPISGTPSAVAPPAVADGDPVRSGLFGAIEDLDELARIAAGCRRCGLRDGCTQVVFGEGDPQAALMLVGEGPGQTEDELGRPFVGKAGQLLDRILAAAGFRREEVYITNVVKCRPPGNRVPTDAEMMTCLPYLHAQIRIIRPAILVCLGSTAVRAVVSPSLRISQARGRWHERWGVRIMATYHPAALLRDPSKKRPVWEDGPSPRAWGLRQAMAMGIRRLRSIPTGVGTTLF